MNKVSKKILEMLKEKHGYLPGQRLSTVLGISRTAIWKHIRDLRKAGYDISAIPNKGYHLVEMSDMLLEEEIHCYLHTETLGERIVFQKEINSTNNLAMVLAADGAPHGTVVTSDSQTSGRGRRGREWFSPPGSNLYMSVILRPSVSPVEATQIPVISVIATIRALKQLNSELLFQIKWPNDILCRGKKLSGTLCEMKSDTDQVQYVVLGIGINVNMESMDPCISDIATSLKLETGLGYSRTRLSAYLLEELEGIYRQWLEVRNLRIFKVEWENHSMLEGKNVKIETPSGIIRGVARGLTDEGALRLERPDGTIQKIFSGDAHISNHSF